MATHFKPCEISFPRMKMVEMAVRASDEFKDAYETFVDLGLEVFRFTHGDKPVGRWARLNETGKSRAGWSALNAVLHDWKTQQHFLAGFAQLLWADYACFGDIVDTAILFRQKCKEECPRIFEIANRLRIDADYEMRVLKNAVNRYRCMSAWYPNVAVSIHNETNSIHLGPHRNSYHAALEMRAHLSQAFQPDLDFADQYIIIAQGSDCDIDALGKNERRYKYYVPAVQA